MGSRRIRQHRRVAPLNIESLFVSLSLPMSPNYCTVLVPCRRPPCCHVGDIDDNPPGRCRKTRMKTHCCRLNNAASSPCCTKRVAPHHCPLRCLPPPLAPPPMLHPSYFIFPPPPLPTSHLLLPHRVSPPSARYPASAALVTCGTPPPA